MRVRSRSASCTLGYPSTRISQHEAAGRSEVELHGARARNPAAGPQLGDESIGAGLARERRHLDREGAIVCLHCGRWRGRCTQLAGDRPRQEAAQSGPQPSMWDVTAAPTLRRRPHSSRRRGTRPRRLRRREAPGSAAQQRACANARRSRNQPGRPRRRTRQDLRRPRQVCHRDRRGLDDLTTGAGLIPTKAGLISTGTSTRFRPASRFARRSRRARVFRSRAM